MHSLSHTPFINHTTISLLLIHAHLFFSLFHFALLLFLLLLLHQLPVIINILFSCVLCFCPSSPPPPSPPIFITIPFSPAPVSVLAPPSISHPNTSSFLLYSFLFCHFLVHFVHFLFISLFFTASTSFFFPQFLFFFYPLYQFPILILHFTCIILSCPLPGSHPFPFFTVTPFSLAPSPIFLSSNSFHVHVSSFYLYSFSIVQFLSLMYSCLFPF